MLGEAGTLTIRHSYEGLLSVDQMYMHVRGVASSLYVSGTQQDVVEPNVQPVDDDRNGCADAGVDGLVRRRIASTIESKLRCSTTSTSCSGHTSLSAQSYGPENCGC